MFVLYLHSNSVIFPPKTSYCITVQKVKYIACLIKTYVRVIENDPVGSFQLEGGRYTRDFYDIANLYFVGEFKQFLRFLESLNIFVASEKNEQI